MAAAVWSAAVDPLGAASESRQSLVFGNRKLSSYRKEA